MMDYKPNVDSGKKKQNNMFIRDRPETNKLKLNCLL